MNLLNIPGLNLSHQEKIKRRRHAIRSFKVKADAKRTMADRFADLLTARFGSVLFLVVNMLVFVGWIAWNTNHIPGVTPFDPYPFGMLTTAVSLEAIVLAIVVLISQNREAKVAELREEVDLQVNMISEEEVTKLIGLVTILLEKQGVKVNEDPELKKLLGTSNDQIERELEEELADRPI